MADTKRALATVAPSGEAYIVEYVAVFDADGLNPVGTRTIAVAGPIYYGDLPGHDGGPLTPSPELFDAIDNWQDLDPEDAAWFEAQEASGNVSYPIGVR